MHLSSIATESERKQNQFSLGSGAKNHYVQLALQDSRYNSAGDWVPAIAITQTQDSRSTLSFLSMATEGRLLVQHQGISWKKFKAPHVISKSKVHNAFLRHAQYQNTTLFPTWCDHTNEGQYKQYFPVRMFIIPYKMTPTFECVDEIVNCDHSNESNREVLSFGVLKCEGY